MEHLLDAIQVSQYLKISKRSLESLLARGEGPRHLWVGRQRRWRPDDLHRWTADRLGSSCVGTGGENQTK